jgi:hypothetical protein
MDEGTSEEIINEGTIIYFTQPQNEYGIHDSNNERF